MADSNYEYDVFISLAHISSTLMWIEKWFMPIFHPALAHELGKCERDVKIYIAKRQLMEDRTGTLNFAKPLLNQKQWLLFYVIRIEIENGAKLNIH